MQIEELIDGAYLESKTIEYKGIIKEGKDKDGKDTEIGWLKTLVAFANTEGGTLYIGVEDKSHKIVALDQNTADKIILMIHRQIRERVEPIIDYDISSIVINDVSPARYVVCVKVKANKNLPVALHNNGMLGIYVRNYGRTDLATQEQIRDLVLMSDNTPYDSPFTDELYHKDDFSKLFSVALDRNVNIEEKELISKMIISPDKKISRGALLFRDNCEDIRTKVVATQWPGVTKGGNVINASEEYVGNILEIIEKTIQFIKNHSVNGYKKEADSRIEYFSYPSRSITEGIVNAIGHRNYYIQGSQVEVNIYRDRMEITSPGSLLGVRELHEEKNISNIIPRRRNDVICALLEMCRYMEKKGSGFDKIEADYSGYGEQYRPYVSADSHSFTLTLPDLTFSGVVSQMSESPEVYVEAALQGKNDLNILSYCYGNSRTVKEISNYISVTPSTYFRKNTITRLVDKGFLIEKKQGKVSRFQSNPEKVKLKNIE
jgi:predicted HTH transcriptional regulator